MSSLIRLSLSLNSEIAEKLDQMANEAGYTNRSEFIRDLIREKHTVLESERGAEVIGTLTIVYNHHRRGLTEEIISLQHNCQENVLASTHVHLSHEICAEMIMLRGTCDGIRSLAFSIKRLKGVLAAELNISPTGQNIS